MTIRGWGGRSLGAICIQDTVIQVIDNSKANCSHASPWRISLGQVYCEREVNRRACGGQWPDVPTTGGGMRKRAKERKLINKGSLLCKYSNQVSKKWYHVGIRMS